MKFGLEDRHLKIVKVILKKYFPNSKVWVFGSRATGMFKRFSDLDLAIDSPHESALFAKVHEEFSESELPIKVDLIAYPSVLVSWRESIDRDRVEFY